MTTPNDTILIQGYGTMSRKTLQIEIRERANEVDGFVIRGDLASAYHFLYQTGVFKAMLETEIEQRKKDEKA